MVLPAFETIFSRSQQKVEHRPILNQLPYTMDNSTNNYYHNFNYQRFWTWFKTRPELVGVINLMCTDIIGDRPEFVGIDDKPLGRNKRLEAERFWKSNRCKESTKAIIKDMFVTGDGYGWIGKLSDKKRIAGVKEIIKKFAPYLRLSVKEQDMMLIKAVQDEDLKKPKMFDYVASSTMQIISTQQEIKGYVQVANGTQVKFTPEEIIHFRLDAINGEVNGFSPIESLVSEIVLISLVKENMLAYLRNGGSPSKMFILPDEISNSKNHRFLTQTLSRYNQVENRNGNLVFTGNINVEDLNSTPRDMEYETLSQYLLSNIALAFNIPATRIPNFIGKSATSGDSGGISDSGYWNGISERQDTVEDLLNLQLFEKLGWKIKLNRKYKQDEVREAQTASMNADTVQKKQSIYRSEGLRMKQGRVMELLGEAAEDLEEIPEEDRIDSETKTGLMNQNMLNNMQLEKEPDSLKKADIKRNVANTQEANTSGV